MAKTSQGDLVIAGTFNLDIDELFDYKYHIDGTSRKIYACDLMYFCSGSDPNKNEALRAFSEWKQYDGDQYYIEKYKIKVWVSVEEFIHPDDHDN
jgi:hypothetical protein